ncbi:MAG: FxLYD domain-containing protein [Christensenellales bacterium]|jgi:hypothetical protein
MKRFVSIAIAIVLLTCTMPALAAGKLSVTQENFTLVKSYSLYGYAYAKVENVGNKPISVHAGILEVFNEEGETLTSTDYLSRYAECLQPGEYTYASIRAELPEGIAEEDVDDYMLTVTGKTNDSYETKRLASTAEYKPGVTEGYWTSDYIYVDVTNDTDEPLPNVAVVATLLDAEGNILYMTSDSLYSSQVLMPGSTIQFRLGIDSSWTEIFEKSEVKVDGADAIAYVNISK